MLPPKGKETEVKIPKHSDLEKLAKEYENAEPPAQFGMYLELEGTVPVRKK